MVGGDPRFHASGFARLLRRPGLGARSPSFALVCALVAIALCLAQCDRAPRAEAIAPGAQASSEASFDERFPAPQFGDRFPTASESLPQLANSQPAPKQTAQPEPASYQVASLEPVALSKHRGMKEDLTILVSMKSSAFPYYGNNPATDTPFLNVTKGGRRGHRTFSGRVYWQDQTYNDSRVLVHIPEGFDIHEPGVIVVFFHGNGATLERDVRDRQMVPQQISESGANAVLLAPQMAVDAFDSSAGKFWKPGGLKRFIKESADHLARLYGDPTAAKAFANMPIVIVGYSGGFLPTAWSLDVGGLADHVRGVVLLDAVYGQLDKFASWIEHHRSAFFVSSYTHYTARHDQDLMRMLRDKGIAVSDDMNAPLHPGSVVFVETGAGITHRNYVTQAWTRDPVERVLAKMAASPALKVAEIAPVSPSR